MNKNAAVYAGTFDPPTLGHIDIILRAKKIFKPLHILVAKNFSKKPLFSPEERIELIKNSLQEVGENNNIVVEALDGLVIDFCQKNKIKVLIRGLRAMSDFEKEFQMATMNRRLDSEVETLQMTTDEKYFFVSSSLVKELAANGRAPTDIVSATVSKALLKKFSENS